MRDGLIAARRTADLAGDRAGGLAWGVYGVVRRQHHGLRPGVRPRLVNVFLAIYSTLPGLPLDGGNVAARVVWGSRDERRGTVAAAWGGRVVAVLVMSIPFWTVDRWRASPDLVGVVFSAIIGFFIWRGAGAALGRG